MILHSKCFSPSVWEVVKAKETFIRYIQQKSFITGKSVLLACALAEVWKQGRLYQVEVEERDRQHQLAMLVSRGASED